MATNDKTPKTMDVSRPGKTAPPASAKPIIVTNRPILRRDPMMATPDGMEKAEPPTATAPVSRVAKTVNVIQPSGSDVAADKSVAVDTKPSTKVAPKVEDLIAAKTGAAAAGSVSESEGTTPKAAPTPTEMTPPSKPDAPDAVKAELQPEDQSEKPAESAATEAPEPDLGGSTDTDDQEDDPEAGSGDAQLTPNQAMEKAKREEDEAKAARQAEEEKIIASKQYYLPMSTVEQRRGLDRVLLVFALVLLVALVWADIVLDAGIIHLGGVHALTHFFTK